MNHDMREFKGFEPYSELTQTIRAGGLSITGERQFARYDNWSNGVKEAESTQNMRLVIEGPIEDVKALLGKNFGKRVAKMRSRT